MIVRFLSFLVLLWIIGFAWFAIDLPRPAANDAHTGSVVVLTGGAGRIDRALDILAAKSAGRLLISGVDRDVKSKELAAEYDRPGDLFDCCIDLGFQAVDTRSNALEIARWGARRGDKSVRLVTSDCICAAPGWNWNGRCRRMSRSCPMRCRPNRRWAHCSSIILNI